MNQTRRPKCPCDSSSDSLNPSPHSRGAGVHLRCKFGFGKTSDFDPFLLLDDFRNDIPEDYLAGFPWHPHRGIETITYVLAGTVEHGDSMKQWFNWRWRCSVDDGRKRNHNTRRWQGVTLPEECTGSSFGPISRRR